MKSFFTSTFFPLQEIAGIDRLGPLNLIVAVNLRRFHWKSYPPFNH